MKPANYAAIYCCLYPQLAEIAREHGYAMAVHGSMARDFDLICIPWIAEPKEPQAVVDAITSKFAINQVGGMEVKNHGRETYTVNVKFGECFLDLSFMPRLSSQPVQDDRQAKDAPLEATAEMVDAAHAIVSQSGGYRRELVWPMYRAMIAALSTTKQEG